jgi:CheY-like chemotaxis protein
LAKLGCLIEYYHDSPDYEEKPWPSRLRSYSFVEDDPNDVELTISALTESRVGNEVVVVHDGEEALEYLYRRGAYEAREEANPAVVLLDLKLPKVDGLEVLKQVKADPNLRTIPIVMLTSSREGTTSCAATTRARTPTWSNR